MRIEGDLATYELSDLLQWLAQGHKTGTLVIHDGEEEYRLGFDRGRIVMSASSDPGQHLDRYLQARGLIDEETMERAERLRAATKMRSGQVLVTLGAISEEQLAAALRQKTEEMICDLLTWREGSFEFNGGEHSDQGRVPISLEVTKLLLESMQRLDDEARPQAAPAPEPPDEVWEAAPREPAAEPRVESETSEEGSAASPEPVPPPEVDSAVAAVLPMPEAAPESQTREGLVLAEILDPASAIGSGGAAAPHEATEPVETPPVHYVATASTGPRSLRRLLPFAAVAILSLSAAGYYLMDRQANAQPGPSTGKPLLFTRPEAPPAGPAPAPAPVEQEARSAPARESASERALRLRYERELATLRRELDETRRRAEGERDAPAPAPEAREALAASAVNAGLAAGGSSGVTPYAARAVPADEVAAGEPAAEAAGPRPTPPASQAAEPRSAVTRPVRDAAPDGPTAAEPAAPTPRSATPEPGSKPATATLGTPKPAVSEPSAADPPAAAGVASAAESQPQLIQRPQPRYPEAARRRGIGASVTVRVLVGEDGRVIEAERVGAKAGLGFDRAAEDAARSSTWKPGVRGGQPAEMWTELRFLFQP